ncbi:Putative multidrug export ATP-binding/permease protein [Roseovarius albus]|uniref:Putative multidrug export ATP-binding/permease protein n=1 Tax=Roseovarius albus TaxID=1247867 RepID=A0A1X6YKN9_9RHOB|nr:ABC transporter ATP-binding protein [Roseovarius albus]SLN23861.1 Putative multidrug export ATP-binding/permease protein [Roseovarius albus]
MFHKFENLIDPFAPASAGPPPATLWAYLQSQLAPFRKWLPWFLLIGFVVALMEIWLIFYSGRLIDLMTDAGPATFWQAHKVEVIAAALFILFLRPILFALNHLLLGQAMASNLQEQARWRAHKHLLGQSSSFFQNDFAGRLTNRVMQVGPAVEDSAYLTLEGIWFSLTYVFGAIVILGDVDIRLAIPLVLWLIVYVLFVRQTALRVAVASEKWSDARSLVTGRVVDAYSNIETVKLFSHVNREEQYALSAMRRLRLRFQRFLRIMTELEFGLNLINGMLMVGVVAPAIWLWSYGEITVGQVAAAAALTIRLNGMSGWIVWVTIELFEHAGVIRESLRSIARPQDVLDAPDAVPLNVKQAEIRFENLSHHYGKNHGGLDHINLTIPAGQKVGIVGRSGAGKSSLVNLLLRFRDAENGRILIDEQPIAQVTQDSLRSAIGMVTQDSSLLHRSVRANILYGKPDATEQQMINAAKHAEAHAFIQDLRDPLGHRGYSAQVGERGVKLSGGQRQRIAIARVILKNAPILILDEATSALDSEVEAEIQHTLYNVMEGKTVIAIAHRLSTIAKMDRIVVLDEGRIVEDGTPDALLSQKGLYASLWARQSGGFIG